MSTIDRIRELMKGSSGLPWKVILKQDKRGIKRDYLMSRNGYVVHPDHGDVNHREDGEIIVLLRNNAEALCDLADDAREIVRREIIDGVGYCPACRYHSSPEWECGCGYGRVRDVLSRLDGDAEGE